MACSPTTNSGSNLRPKEALVLWPYSDLPDPSQFSTWQDLVEATQQCLQDTANHTPTGTPSFTQAETLLLSKAQSESFPEDFHAPKSNKELPTTSHLSSLAPQFEHKLNLIRVGGRLRLAEELEPGAMYPIVLDPRHPVTRLIIRDYDTHLLHPGPGRVYAEIRRSYWILRGRQAIKKHQWTCIECRKWRAKPIIPKRADLPPSRVCLTQPPIWSTGMDCFGPLLIKVGRKTEKRWGLLFKCLTTHCLHIEIHTSLDTDSFLMALRRFTARQGQPFELLSDCCTNFKGV